MAPPNSARGGPAGGKDHQQDALASTMSTSLHSSTSAVPPLLWSGASTRSGDGMLTKEPLSDHAAWTAQARSQLSSARELRQQAKLCLQQSSARSARQVPPSGPPTGEAAIAMATAAAVAQERWKRKTVTSQGIANKVQSRLETVQSTIRRLTQVVGDLQRAGGARYAALSVVEKRLEIRTKRPPSELTKDAFEDALHQEREVLERVREKLSQQVEEGQELQARLAEVLEEMNRGRHTLHLERTNRPAELLSEVQGLEDAASRFCLESSTLLQNTQRECNKASAQTVSAMRKRVAQTVELRKELENEIHETRCTIAETEQHLERIAVKLRRYHAAPEREFDDDLDDSMHQKSRASVPATASFSKLRAKIKAAAYTGHSGRQMSVVFQRFDRDGSGELDEDELRRALRRTLRIPPNSISDAEIAHLCSVLDADKSGQISIHELVSFLEADDDIIALQEEHEAANALLEQLHVTRQELLEDLRCKTAAWRIDETCIKVTPIKGLELDSLPAPGKERDPLGLAHSKKRKPNLTAEAVQKIRAKLQGSVCNYTDRQLEVLFGRFDKDGSGQLEHHDVRKAFRQQLKIQEVTMKDADISNICSLLDPDGTGLILISDLISFAITESDVVPTRTGKSLAGASLAPINTVDAKRPATSPHGGSVQSPQSARGQPGRKLAAQEQSKYGQKTEAHAGKSLAGIKLEPLSNDAAAAELTT